MIFSKRILFLITLITSAIIFSGCGSSGDGDSDNTPEFLINCISRYQGGEFDGQIAGLGNEDSQQGIVAAFIRFNIDAGNLIILDETTGRRITYSVDNTTFSNELIILQREGDVGLTSTLGDLQTCSFPIF